MYSIPKGLEQATYVVRQCRWQRPGVDGRHSDILCKPSIVIDTENLCLQTDMLIPFPAGYAAPADTVCLYSNPLAHFAEIDLRPDLDNLTRDLVPQGVWRLDTAL